MPRDNERVNFEAQKKVNTRQTKTTKGDEPTINTGPVVNGERQPDTVTLNREGGIESIAAPGAGALPRETGFNEELGFNPDGNQDLPRRPSQTAPLANPAGPAAVEEAIVKEQVEGNRRND